MADKRRQQNYSPIDANGGMSVDPFLGGMTPATGLPAPWFAAARLRLRNALNNQSPDMATAAFQRDESRGVRSRFQDAMAVPSRDLATIAAPAFGGTVYNPSGRQAASPEGGNYPPTVPNVGPAHMQPYLGVHNLPYKASNPAGGGNNVPESGTPQPVRPWRNPGAMPWDLPFANPTGGFDINPRQIALPGYEQPGAETDRAMPFAPRSLPGLPAYMQPFTGLHNAPYGTPYEAPFTGLHNRPYGPDGRVAPGDDEEPQPTPAAPPMPAARQIADAPGVAEAPDTQMPQGSNDEPVSGGQAGQAGAAAPAAQAAPEKPGLLARILGAGDGTPGADGLTAGDRSQLGFSTIGQIGAMLMAAGEPMWGNERARYLAGLSQVPANMQEQKGQMVQQRRQGQQLIADRRANEAARAIQEMANDPEAMRGLSPHQQTILRAAYLTGNPTQALAAQKEVREAGQPIPLGNGMFWDRATNTAINPITGMHFKLGPNGEQMGPGVYAATGKAPGDNDSQPNEDGFYHNWLQSAVPSQYHEQVRAIAEGRQKLPSSSGRDGGLNAQLINWARQYNPALDQTTYDTRVKAAKDYAPSGAVGKTIVSLNTLLQHTRDLRDAAAELKNGQIPAWNAVANAATSAVGGAAPTRFDQVRGLVSRELDTLLSGGRVTIAETEEIRSKLNNSQSPEQLQAVLDQMTHLAEARLQSVTQQGQRALGKKGMQSLSEQLQNPKGMEAVEYLKNNPLPGSPRAKAQPSPFPQYPDAKRAPDGNYYVQKDGKYFRVQ